MRDLWAECGTVNEAIDVLKKLKEARHILTVITDVKEDMIDDRRTAVRMLDRYIEDITWACKKHQA